MRMKVFIKGLIDWASDVGRLQLCRPSKGQGRVHIHEVETQQLSEGLGPFSSPVPSRKLYTHASGTP